jgi:hypothetical protein
MMFSYKARGPRFLRRVDIMIKKLLIVAGFAAACGVSAQVAEAKVNVTIGVGGFPSYCSYRYDPHHCYGYRYRPYNRFYDDDFDEPYIRDTISCREARGIVSERGYRRVSTVECRGVSYTFLAQRRGKNYQIKVHSYSGDIISIRRVR